MLFKENHAILCSNYDNQALYWKDIIMKKLFAISMTCLLTCLLVLPVCAESTTESPVIPTLGNGDGLLVDGLALFLVAVILFAVIVFFYRVLGPKDKKPGSPLKKNRK